MPTRLVLQRLLAIGLKTRIPAFFNFTLWVMTPLLLDAPVRVLNFGPLIWTWMPLTAWPCFVTRIVSFVVRPTKSWFGVTLLTATQNTGGGVRLATTSTVAVAVLLAVFVSGLLPTTVTVFT